MNILLVSGSMSIYSGGPPRVVAGTAEALAKRGHTVTVATLKENTESAETIINEFPRLNHKNITLMPFKTSFPGFLRRSNSLLRRMRSQIHKYDIVHVHGVWEGCMGEIFLLSRRNKIPFFISSHGLFDPWSLKQSSWKKKLSINLLPTGRMIDEANAIIYATHDEMDEGKKILKTVSCVLPNGIDISSLNRDNLPDDLALRQIYPQLNEWDRTFLFYSRIHPKKGLHLLLQAFLSLDHTDTSAGLLIVGIPQDKDYEIELRSLIANSPHGDKILFITNLVGRDSQVALRCGDVFVLPSYQEGFSMAILEAMACELPVLISDKCHFPEVESEWGAGLVVSPELISLRNGLLSLLSLPKKELSEMGARGREAIARNFDWSSVAERLEKIYLGQNYV